VSFQNKIAHSILWVSISNISLKFVNFFITIILARLLEPSDFGLVAIAFIIVNFFEILRDLGIGAALIHRKEDSDIAADTAFFLFPLIAVIFYLVAYLIAPSASKFFREDELTSIIRVLSFTLIIWSFGNLPRTLISKELSFKKMAVSETVSKISYGIAAILMALNGFGVWSIVGGRLFLEITAVITIWKVLDWRPSFRFDKKIAIELLNYGKHVITASIIVFIISIVDVTVIGHELGSESLGYYNIALSTASMFTIQTARTLSKVMFPAYSIIQKDMEKMRKAYLKTLRYLSMIIFPASFGIISIAWYFIKVIYGDKWLPAVTMLQVLSIYGLSNAMINITDNVYLAAGKPKIQTDIYVVQLIIILILIYPLTLTYGALGTAMSVTVPALLTLFISFYEAGKIIDKDLISLLKTILPATIGSLIMASLILITQKFIFYLSPLLTLLLSISIGIAIYLIFIRFAYQRELEDVKELIREIKHRLVIA
jgi:O-antigen/teichoic acid export membrane protein